MNVIDMLECQINLEGEKLPTVREIIESHFVASVGGNVTMGKMIAAQYISYLISRMPVDADTTQSKTAEPSAGTQTDARSSDQKSGSTTAGTRIGTDAEALLKSMGVPVGEDGRIDFMGALAGAMSAEGRGTPLGTIVGTVLRGLGEAGKPRP